MRKSKVAKSRKKSQKYYCKECDYITSRKNDYTKHLRSKRHLEICKSCVSQNVSQKSQKVAKTYICEYCNKEYAHRQSLYSHKKKCKFKQASVEDKKTDIIPYDNKKTDVVPFDNEKMELKLELAEKKGEIKAYKKLINEGKLGDTYNGDTYNTTNNNITLNVFLNEHCKDALNLEDFMKNIHFQLKDVLNNGNYVEDCVSVKLLNDLNEIPVTKRPIHCTDQKRKNFVVKDKEEGWVKEKANEGGKIQKEIDKLYDKAYVEFYHAYDDEHPYPQNSKQEDIKQQTSYKLNQKKDKYKILGTVAKEVDVKEAMKDLNENDS